MLHFVFWIGQSSEIELKLTKL